MINNNFDQIFLEYAKKVESDLTCLFDSISVVPPLLKESMSYSVLNGGKRVRGVLVYLSGKCLQVEENRLTAYSNAIELVHAYSLVHDDLPCMDNDDFRRGKLSTHKKFGEANGVLAGDGLLNLAFETVLSSKFFGEKDKDAILTLAKYAGSSGMIAGQSLDMNNNKLEVNKENLFLLFKLKTSNLLTVPLIIPSILKNGLYYNELKEYGENLGYLFQITDDVLDVTSDFSSLGKTPGKDKSLDKFTAVKILGLEGAISEAKKTYEKCMNILKNIKNSDLLLDFTEKIYNRKN